MILAWALSARADLDWAIANRSDEEILSRLEKLMPHVAQTPGAVDAPVVILEEGSNYRLKNRRSVDFMIRWSFDALVPRSCYNEVTLVQDPDRVPEDWTSFYVGSSRDVEEIAAFLVRDGRLRRLDESRWSIHEGEGFARMDRIDIDFGPLQAGDVIGYSLVTDRQYPLVGRVFVAADRVPVVYYSLRILANGAVNYEIHGDGFDEEPTVNTAEERKGRPSAWQVSALHLPAFPDLPYTSLVSSDVPRFTVAAVEMYLESDSWHVTEWASVRGWNWTLLAFADYDESLDAEGLDVAATVSLKGDETPDEKIRRICTYTRDRLTLLEGPEIDDGAWRPDARDAVISGESTEREKVFLTLAMLKAEGIPANLAFARPAFMGPLRPDAALHGGAFPVSVVHLLGHEPEYFLPQCTECELGVFPESWNGATVLVPKPDVRGLEHEFRMAFAAAESKAGRPIPAEVARARERVPWYTVEVVPPTVHH